jgi:SAM-dependent methyltransferase
VELLAGLAAPGLRALELGVGTGAVAIPLAQRGVAVTGIDISPKMLARLAENPGGDKVRTVLGDMQEIGVEGSFDLVYAVSSTFYGLFTQEAQVECLTRAAARLAPDGKVLIEAFVPDPARFSGGQAFRTVSVGEDRVVAEASRHDPIAQRIDTSRLYLRQGQPVDMVPVRIRYVHVAELDLMARVAGLALHSRWAGWNREPFGPGAGMHVSVYCARR